MLGFAHSLVTAWIAAPAAGTPLTMPLSVLAAVAASACAFAMFRLNQERQARVALEGEVATHRDKQADLKSRERTLKDAQAAKREELQSLRQEVGTLRKKNHGLQEDIRKLRESLRSETKAREEAQNSRPAFADQDVKPRSRDLLEAMGADEGKAQKPAAKPEPEAKPEPAAPPARSPELIEALHDAKVRQLQSDLQAARQTLDGERTVAAAQKDELRKVRRRAEDLRRIDIISKSKLELLEDKLRGLGRQYYDAISELAAARGEVVPPRPRDLAPPPPADDKRAEAEALAEAEHDEEPTAILRPEHEVGMGVSA